MKKEQASLLKQAEDAEAAIKLSGPEKQPTTWNAKDFEDKPVEFGIKILGFNPTSYQAKLLEDKGKRIVVVWPRQSGKTTTLAVRMIWYAATHPGTTSLIVARAAANP